MKALTVLSVVLSALALCGPGLTSGFSNAGREFFLAFFRNRLFERDPIAYLLVTSSQPNGPPIPFTVDLPMLRFSERGTAISGQFERINLPKAAVVSRSSGFNNVIRVRADSESKGDLVIVGVNEDEASTDSFLALPAVHSPTGVYEYTAFSTRKTSLIFEGSSVVLAVATEDLTEVTITPTRSASVRVLRPRLVAAGDTRTYTLNQMSMMYAFSEYDLTGSVIRSNKPLSVFVGHECGNVPFNVSTCDHLLEQVPPSDTWGRLYHTSPLFTRTGGDQFKVVASKNNTAITMECVDVSSKKTRTTAFELGYFKFQTVHAASNEYCRFESNLPFLIMQYSLGQGFDLAHHADPFISLIQSDEQFLSSYSFTTIKGEEDALPFVSYVNIIMPTVYYDPTAIMIDGSPLRSYTALVKKIANITFTESFDVTVITLGNIPIGSHFINHTEPNAAFSALVYGYTDQTSYGFPAGYGQRLISISTLSLEVESANVREDKGPFVFHCKRVGLTHFPVDITVVTQELVGGAIAGKDFVPLRKVLHFEAGEVDKTVEVAIIDDAVEESDRSLNLTLLKKAGQASVALAETGHQLEVTILDNDATVIIDLISREYRITEGEKVLRVGVRRTGFISTDIEVTLQVREDSSPTNNVNGVSVLEFTVLFNKSNTDKVAIVYVSIPIEDDDVVKEDRKFVVQLFLPLTDDPLPPMKVETQTANVSVMEDDVITFEYALDFLSVSEGDKNVEICVNKIGRTTLRLAVGVLSSANTSEDGTDFKAVNIDLTFNAADQRKCFQLQLIDDNRPEPAESFTLNLFRVGGDKAVIGQQGQLTVQIADDDTIMLGFRDATVMGDEGMASMICIEHSPQFDAALPFLVNVTGGNASTVDYRINLPNSEIVSVVGSASENCFMVSIAMDGVAEGTEVVEFTLMPTSSIPANLSIQITMATTQLVIKDLDMIGVVFKTDRPLSVSEGGTVNLCADKIGRTNQVIRVTIGLKSSTDPAVVLMNYDPVLVFQPNDDEACTSLTIPDDDVASGSAFLEFNLTSYESAGAEVILVPMSLFLSVLDDEVLPIGFNSSQYVVDEGVGMVTVCIVTGKEFRNQEPLELLVQVESRNTNGTADKDYTSFETVAVPLDLEAGQSESCFELFILDDSVQEADEVIGLLLMPDQEQPGFISLRGTRTSIVVKDDDIVVVQMEFSEVTVSETDALVEVCAVRVGKSVFSTTVLLATEEGSAMVDVDFFSSSATMTIEPEANKTCISVPIIDDFNTELEESLFVTVSTLPTTFERTVIGEPNKTEVFIQDDDPVVVQFEESRITVNESAGASVEVCLVKEGMTSLIVTVTVIAQELTADNSASVSSDLATNQFEVTFGSGVQRACGVVRVIDDQVVERDEVVAFNISSIGGMGENGHVMYMVGERAQVVMEIRDDDVATIMFANKTISIIEGEPPSLLCATLKGTAAIPVWILLMEVDINTTSGEDYVSISGIMLTFAPFTNTVCINLTIIDDTLEEEDEVFVIEMSSLTKGAVADQSAVLVTIRDDDSLRFRFTEGPFIRNESVSEVLLLCVQKTGVTVNNFVFVINTGGSATVDVDYTLSTSTLQFANDQVEVCFELAITDDSLLEGSEIIQISLTTPGRPALNTSVTIIDDDSVEISFEPVMYQTNEANGGVTLRVVIVGEVATSLEYSVQFFPMSASRSDFNSDEITRVLPLRGSNDSFRVEVFDDSVPEGSEMFEARLVVPSASAEKGLRESLTANTAVIVIEDDDLVTVTFASDKFTVREGDGVAMVTIQTDTAAANELTLRVSALLSYSATVRDDFSPVRETVTIPAGSTSAHANISIVDDMLAEPTESFNVTLSIVTPQTVLLSQFGPFQETTVEILDNDRITFEWEREIYRVREGAGLLPLQVVSLLAASYDITLEFEVIEMSAQENQNFQIVTSSPLVISVGDTSVNVVTNILNDTVFEGNKTFSLRLLTLTAQEDVDMSPVVGSVAVTTVTIIEDDTKVAVSFERDMYIVSEGDEAMEVCLITEGVGLPTSSFSVPIKFVNQTAISGEDFVPPASMLMPFSIGQGRSCVRVGIIDDKVHEETEVFSVRMDTESSFMPQEVAVGRTNLSRLSIMDNDNPLRQCIVNSTIIVPFHLPNSTSPISYAMEATCQHVLVSTCSDFMRGPIRIDADFRGDRIETLAARIGTTQVLFLSNETYVRESSTPTVGGDDVLSPVTVEQTSDEISVNGGNGLIVITRRYGENPSISITLSSGMLKSGTCGLCGSEEGRLSFRSTFPLQENYTQTALTRYIKSWKVDFEEGLFPVDPRDTQCATMRNDSIVTDPLLTIPLYLHDHPVEVYRKVALCYEVRGHQNTIYNLISDKCVSVNGQYKELAAPKTGYNVLGAVGVVAIDNQGECVTIAVEQIMGTCMTKVNGKLLFSPFKKNGVVVDIAHDKVQINIPNCEMVDIIIWIMCEEVNGHDMIKFVVTRGVNMWPTSHGLLGQYWNVPAYVSKVGSRSHSYQVTLKYPGSKQRVFNAVYYRYTWLWRRTPCLYAGDSQGNGATLAGNSVLEGSIFDYVMDSLLDTEYSFSRFEGDRCTQRET